MPDAEPRLEPIRVGGPNKPYGALGRDYVPLTADREFSERGLASWYGRKFHGRPTASGEPYDMYAMTAAHPTLPIPSYVRVRNPANGREVVVRVNDRGPFHAGRIIDLSYAAAFKLGVLKGVAPVELSRITFDDIRTGAWRKGAPVDVTVPPILPVADRDATDVAAPASAPRRRAASGSSSAHFGSAKAPTASTTASSPTSTGWRRCWRCSPNRAASVCRPVPSRAAMKRAASRSAFAKRCGSCR